MGLGGKSSKKGRRKKMKEVVCTMGLCENETENTKKKKKIFFVFVYVWSVVLRRGGVEIFDFFSHIKTKKGRQKQGYHFFISVDR